MNSDSELKSARVNQDLDLNVNLFCHPLPPPRTNSTIFFSVTSCDMSGFLFVHPCLHNNNDDNDDNGHDNDADDNNSNDNDEGDHNSNDDEDNNNDDNC